MVLAPFSRLLDLVCTRTGKASPADQLWNLSPAGSPLFARYDLDGAAKTLRRDRLNERPLSIWRYHEVLPAPTQGAIVSLGEGMTPLLAMPRFGPKVGFAHLLLKDESRNPTGSFKDRGMSVAVTMANYLGIQHVVIPTAGNAGGSASAYAARANIEIDVVMPNDSPFANQEECRRSGANLELVDGFLDACGRRATTLSESQGWFDLSTFKEPYRVEGKKTMAYELVEQLDGTLPDAIVYPTGGGTGLAAMWKAFGELEELGWIDAKRPRMISVQADGCAPLVKAFEAGSELAQAWLNPTTRVSGLRAPKILADALCLQTLRESGGTAIAVPDEAMFEFLHQAGALEGISICPEGAACLAALPELLARGDLDRNERIVVFNTASAHKYTDLVAEFSSHKTHR